MSAEPMLSCMGGWCALRDLCPHYHTQWRGRPAERLCKPGLDGESDVTTSMREYIVKRCIVCGIDKHLHAFHRDTHSKDHHANRCKACTVVIDRARRHPEAEAAT